MAPGIPIPNVEALDVVAQIDVDIGQAEPVAPTYHHELSQVVPHLDVLAPLALNCPVAMRLPRFPPTFTCPPPDVCRSLPTESVVMFWPTRSCPPELNVTFPVTEPPPFTIRVVTLAATEIIPLPDAEDTAIERDGAGHGKRTGQVG